MSPGKVHGRNLTQATGSMPHRVKRERTKGWRMPENTVYVGRPGPWGNPWLAKDAVEAGYKDGPKMAAFAFRMWLLDHRDYRRAQPDPGRDFILSNLGALRGKNLACWCKIGDPCHADVLLDLANAPHPSAARRAG